MERRLDSDYIPCYSGRATCESEISAVVVDTYFRDTATSSSTCAARSGAIPKPTEDTVQRWSRENSEVIIRKPSQRRASVYAKAKIRHTLVSDQDRQDASYNGTNTRKDTPRCPPAYHLTQKPRQAMVFGKGRSHPPMTSFSQDRQFTNAMTENSQTWLGVLKHLLQISLPLRLLRNVKGKA